MLATVAVLIAVAPPVMDRGVLIGLRGPNGSLRTVLVSQRGVAYVSKEHKDEVLKSNKQAVLAYRVDGENVMLQGRPYKIGGKFRIAWLANAGVGLEFDASRPGELPYARVHRRVVRFNNVDEVIEVGLTRTVSEVGLAKIKEAAERLRSAPNETDWGYVRNQGKWDFVGSVGSGDARKEITVTGETFSATPSNRSDIPWREVVNEHPDATDLVASADAPFAVVVTPTHLVVREASRAGLGRVLRRIPASAESVVHFEFGAAGPLESWHEYIKG